MNTTIVVTFMLTITTGCTSWSGQQRKSLRSLAEKRQEIEVLRNEVEVSLHALTETQERLVPRLDVRDANAKGDPKIYTQESQGRDLDQIITIFRQARDRLSAEDRRLHKEYSLDHGPY